MAKKVRKRDQSKTALAAIFNKRIDQLRAEGADERYLPEKITDPSAFTHRELRRIRSAASKANSTGVRAVHGGLIPEITGSYYEALNDIVNKRRGRWRKIAQESAVSENGILREDGLKRGQMGDTRSDLFKPIKKYTPEQFRSAEGYTDAIKTMRRMAENARGEQFTDNIIQALYHAYGSSKDPNVVRKMNVAISTIKRASVDRVLKAYFREERFTFLDVYESDAKEGVLDSILTALEATGAKIRRAWKKDLDYAADLLAQKAEREKKEFIKLNRR